MELSRPLLIRVARVLVTGLVLVILAGSVDVRATLSAFLGADVRWLLLAIPTILLIRLLMAVRWWLILSAYGLPVDLWKITKLIFVSSSLGSVLPAGIGQDLLRGYHIVRTHGRVSQVSASIIVDRALGVFSMALVAALAGIVAVGLLEPPPALRLAAVSAGALLLGLAAAYGFRRRLRRWCRFDDTRLPGKLAEGLNALSASIFADSVDSRVLVSTLALSVLVQLTRTVAFVLVFTALGADTDSLYYFVAIPMMFLLLQLPISLGGLGVREAALVVLFRDTALGPEISVAGGLLFQCLQLVALVPGLVLFVSSRDRSESRAVR
jgi:uncharacterized protein (TIRG00374 family)